MSWTHWGAWKICRELQGFSFCESSIMLKWAFCYYSYFRVIPALMRNSIVLLATPTKTHCFAKLDFGVLIIFVCHRWPHFGEKICILCLSKKNLSTQQTLNHIASENIYLVYRIKDKEDLVSSFKKFTVCEVYICYICPKKMQGTYEDVSGPSEKQYFNQ